MSDTVGVSDWAAVERMLVVLPMHAQAVHECRADGLATAGVLRQRANALLELIRTRERRAAERLEGCDDATLRERLNSELRQASGAVAQARRLVGRLDLAIDQLSSASLTQARIVQDLSTSGTTTLAGWIERFHHAQASFAAASLAVAAAVAPTSPGQPFIALPKGYGMVSLDQIDDRDSGVTGPSDFSKVSFEDMQAGLLLLQHEVLPSLALGRGRAELAEADRRDATGGPSRAEVYDAFFSSTAIKLDRRGDGTYEIRNGYHRIWAAKQLGIDALPASLGPSAL